MTDGRDEMFDGNKYRMEPLTQRKEDERRDMRGRQRRRGTCVEVEGERYRR